MPCLYVNKSTTSSLKHWKSKFFLVGKRILAQIVLKWSDEQDRHYNKINETLSHGLIPICKAPDKDWKQLGVYPLLFGLIVYLYPPQTLFVGVYCFHVVRPCVRNALCPSVTLCFLNNSKSHCWIFIKPCKHVHICKTNTLDKKVRARGQFY